jgi:hypothetical protein
LSLAARVVARPRRQGTAIGAIGSQRGIRRSRPSCRRITGEVYGVTGVGAWSGRPRPEGGLPAADREPERQTGAPVHAPRRSGPTDAPYPSAGRAALEASSRPARGRPRRCSGIRKRVPWRRPFSHRGKRKSVASLPCAGLPCPGRQRLAPGPPISDQLKAPVLSVLHPTFAGETALKARAAENVPRRTKRRNRMRSPSFSGAWPRRAVGN